MRLIRSLGLTVDEEYFAEDDAWAFVGDLAQYAKDNKPLSAATQQVLLDLGVALGLKPGAPEHHFSPALEAQLGPSPHEPQTVLEVVRYVRAHLNGQFEEGKPASDTAKLSGGGQVGPHLPHKNYNFGED